MGQKKGQAGAKIGRMGEDAACTHLCSLGQTILERNWRCGHLETDIISLGSDGIHFVEVKARVAPSTTDPSENVGYAKQRNMAKAARATPSRPSSFLSTGTKRAPSRLPGGVTRQTLKGSLQVRSSISFRTRAVAPSLTGPTPCSVKLSKE